MAALRQDLTFTFRRLAKSPGFVAASVLSIALGIAANSTIFSMVSRFVLRPAPVGDPASLLALHTMQRGECCNQFTWPLFNDVREQAKSFSGLAAYYELIPASVGGHGDPERVWGQAATTNFFDVAQLRLPLGRGFLVGEERAAVAVIGYGLWQTRFGADSAILGKSVTLSGRPFTVVGVAPQGFHGLDQILFTQFWIPLGNTDLLLPNVTNFNSRNYNWLAVTGRLRPGVSRTQASTELDVIARRVAQAHPVAEKDRAFRFEPAGSLPPRDRAAVLFFLGALTIVVLLVLLIACANLANLLLAQASGRRKEMAVRLALGATRADLMRQMLAESVLLALGGGLLGVFLSLWATSALSALHLPAPVPLDLSISVDWRTLLYNFILSAGTGLVFGIAPAWLAASPVIVRALKGEDTLARPGRPWTLRNILVIAQISISLVLLCITGLFLRSLDSAGSINIGFRSTGVVMMSVDPRLHGYSAERTAQFLNLLRSRIATLPGVVSVACTDVVPLSMGNRSDSFTAEGAPPAPEGRSVDLYMATPGYFATLGIPRLAGRDFAEDNATQPKVAVVNETFVKQVFPRDNPLGRTVTGGGLSYRVIGVVKDIKSRTLGEDLRPVLFRSLSQSVDSDPSMMGYSVLVRSSGDASAVKLAMRREIGSLDPTLAVFNAETMEQHFRNALFLPRLAGILFGIFGGIGLLLASVGLYGVMSYATSRRTHEIGIRMALGARTGAVQRSILRQGMLLATIAVALGLAAAWGLTRFAASFLYGIRPHDAATFTLVPVLLLGIALLACWIPARCAARVDPLTALRHE